MPPPFIMNIQTYIKKNWNSLPKSSFNGIQVVIFETVEHYDGDYGHHSYEGYGANEAGELVVAVSSGCSCDGSCYVSSAGSAYVSKDVDLDFENFTPEMVDFSSQQVYFEDYG